MDCSSLFGTETPIIGMIHLGALPGAPGATADLTAVCAAARRDAERLVAGGVDGAIVGTALKEAGQTTNPVSTERVEQFMDRVERVRAETVD